MITQVLRSYLAGIRRERQFDVPFGLLLPACDFYDVHFTHGTIEFGKDFIAKTTEQGVEIQCSFQIKKGDIGLPEWRDGIQQQMLQSVLTPLRHPNFDRSLPHQAYLVTTGELSTPAALAIDEMNTEIREFYRKTPFRIWSQYNLVDLFQEFGLDSLYEASAEGYSEYGAFFQLYSQTLRGEVTVDSIETYSRHWTKEASDFERWALICALECEALALQCIKNGQVYEAVYVYFCRLRALCHATYLYREHDLSAMFEFSIPRIVEQCTRYVDELRSSWTVHQDLLASEVAPTDFVSYPVQCARFMEIASVLYFFNGDADSREQTVDLLEAFIRREPGCAHPISDRYAISLVIASLTLLHAARKEPVRHLLKQATVWLCDRYELGLGLATVDADEREEIETLLGYIFDFTKMTQRHTSLLATAICDLSVLVGDGSLYADIRNDLEAIQIQGEYFQTRDTQGACLLDSEDVLFYPTVRYANDLRNWSDYDFADHIREEVGDYVFVRQLGPAAALAVSIVLRDRFFPRVWAPILDSEQ